MLTLFFDLRLSIFIIAKSPEEIRKTFNITNDFTPEEEDQVRRENGMEPRVLSQDIFGVAALLTRNNFSSNYKLTSVVFSVFSFAVNSKESLMNNNDC